MGFPMLISPPTLQPNLYSLFALFFPNCSSSTPSRSLDPLPYSCVVTWWLFLIHCFRFYSIYLYVFMHAYQCVCVYGYVCQWDLSDVCTTGWHTVCIESWRKNLYLPTYWLTCFSLSSVSAADHWRISELMGRSVCSQMSRSHLWELWCRTAVGLASVPFTSSLNAGAVASWSSSSCSSPFSYIIHIS